MNYNDIKLNNLSKSFEFEKICRDVDSMSLDDAKEYCKLCIKLYLKQQEVICDLGKL